MTNLALADLLHYEKYSPLPYKAGEAAPWTPTSAYELLKMELQYWILSHQDDSETALTDVEIQSEACRIIFGADILCENDSDAGPSWLRDLVMASTELTQNAMLQTIRGQAKNRLSTLQINGKSNIFQDCELERQLREAYSASATQCGGHTVADSYLQSEAARIIAQTEERCNAPSEVVASWLQRLLNHSTEWLRPFKKRVAPSTAEHVATSENEVVEPFPWLQDHDGPGNVIDPVPQAFPLLGDYGISQGLIGHSFSKSSDACSRDDNAPTNIDAFGEQDIFSGLQLMDDMDSANCISLVSTADVEQSRSYPLSSRGRLSGQPSRLTSREKQINESGRSPNMMRIPHFPKGVNAYRYLAHDLSRFVAMSMSDQNPNKHVPSDEEIQQQARWLEFDE